MEDGGRLDHAVGGFLGKVGTMALEIKDWSDSRPETGAERIRVLQVINSLVVGGAEQLLVTLARYIDTERFDLRVCSLAPLDDTPILRDLQALGVPVYGVARRRGHDPRHAVRLLALIRSHGVDVVHTHLAYANTIGALAGMLSGRPVISTLHSIRNVHNPRSRSGRLKRSAQMQMLRWGTRTVVACAPAVRTVAVEELRLPAGKVVAVANGIDTEAFGAVDPADTAACRAELLAAGAGPLVVAVGNLLQAKGHVHLVGATRLLTEQWPGLRVAIVGRLGDGAEAVRARIAAEGLGERVALTGQRRDVAALVSAADLFVLPSLTEAMPLALLEAMSAGVPVVATRVGGVPEVVEDGVTGRLAAPRDEAGLAEAIAAMLKDRPSALRMGRAGQARVRALYGAAGWARRLEDIYVSAARSASRPVLSPNGRSQTMHGAHVANGGS